MFCYELLIPRTFFKKFRRLLLFKSDDDAVAGPPADRAKLASEISLIAVFSFFEELKERVPVP